jgi:hypothetical protein
VQNSSGTREQEAEQRTVAMSIGEKSRNEGELDLEFGYFLPDTATIVRFKKHHVSEGVHHRNQTKGNKKGHE